jgi:hypothetical protein
MVAAVAITRKGYTAEQLRDSAKRTKDADAARRMLALALVLESRSRCSLAQDRSRTGDRATLWGQISRSDRSVICCVG